MSCGPVRGREVEEVPPAAFEGQLLTSSQKQNLKTVSVIKNS